jgi:hypothetical protein
MRDEKALLEALSQLLKFRVCFETLFDEWIREADQKLLDSGDYLLIDSTEVDMSGELRTLANRVAPPSCSGVMSRPYRLPRPSGDLDRGIQYRREGYQSAEL